MKALPVEIIETVKARYAEPQRAYHNWSHIEAMLRWMQSGEFTIDDTNATYCAVIFHDAIYDPTAKDNEERSAILAEAALAPYVDAQSLALTVAMIRATANHRMVEDVGMACASDLAHFLDMDLSILGSDWSIFETYERNIRAEYSCYPDALFWPGRCAVLESFLNRDRLYFSDWGMNRFETKARRNLAQAIALARRNLT
jgi:predicted metal-dependent HD superfamily phosphohydrolase